MVIKFNKKVVKILVISCLVLSISFTVGMSGIGKNFYSKNKKPIYSVNRQDKKISISFDCAWGVDYTQQLLDIMEVYKVKSTFFMVEFWTNKYPEYVKKISDAGHEIGTHLLPKLRAHKYLRALF